jgi:uncharacterized protein (TIGR03382 family)
MNIKLALVAVAGLTAMASADTVVFSNDFEGAAPSEISIGGIEGSAGFSAHGFGNNLWRNDTFSATTLTLTNLPAHTSLSMKLLLGVIDSWDGIGGSPGPDAFDIRVDGQTVWSYIFASASGSTNYPEAALGAGGFGWNSWNDYAYDLTNDAELMAIPHTASSVTIEFQGMGSGWQGGSDESFAIDNLEVSVNAIPAPGAAALAGLAGLVGLRRRR